MQRELNTLEERVLELISLNESLRKVNKDLVSQLNKKLDECEMLQKKVNLSKTSLMRIQKNTLMNINKPLVKRLIFP